MQHDESWRWMEPHRRWVGLALLAAGCGDAVETTAPTAPSRSPRESFSAAEGAQPAPLDARTLPAAALRAGQLRLIDEDPRFTFEFVGDETLRYSIDTSHPEVLGGLLRIEELTTGCAPTSEAGPTYRDANGVLRSPRWMYELGLTTLETERIGDTLRLLYTDAIDGGHTRTVELRLVGKALEVRVRDVDGSVAASANYAGFDPGPTQGVPSPRDLRIPSMAAVPVTHFRAATGEGAYTTLQYDWSRSNAGAIGIPTYAQVTSGTDWIDSGVELLYPINSGGSLNAALDDTFFVVVTRALEDTFPESTATPSPYRDVLSGRTVALFSRSGVPWHQKSEHLRQLRSFGMDQLAVYDFYWWSQSTQGASHQIQSHVWVPAVDEGGCLDFCAEAAGSGVLHGFYMLLGLNESQPFHEPTDGVLDSQGERRPRISPTRALAHSLREDSEMRARYATSLAFYDIWGYEHPEIVVDFEADQIDKAKTIAAALVDKRRLFRQLQALHEGPVLSEGSGAHLMLSRNFELLMAGYCDSNQGSLTTGAEVPLGQLQAGDPLTPESWWVLPDYALRVLGRLNVEHGLGFYDRFLHEPQTPLADALLDRYRAHELTYGRASFFQTTGPVNGTQPGQLNNRLTHAGMIKEYYLMQALQREYLTSPIETVQYEVNGQLRTADEVIDASTHPGGPLEEFRDPRLCLTYTNGLVVWVNHAVAPWAGVSVGGRVFTLPEDGFVAHDPRTGLWAFSARCTAPAGEATPGRIDYALAPGWYELLDGRGVVGAYGGLTHPLGSQRLVVRNDVRALLVAEDELGAIEVSEGTRPPLRHIAVVADHTLEVGERALLRAVGLYDGDTEQELSYLLGTWRSSDARVVAVNRAGVIDALGRGAATLTFESEGVVSEGFVVDVE